MATLYLLRQGIGDDRIASRFRVRAERVKDCYGDKNVHFSSGLPTVNGGPANAVADLQFAVVELTQGELAFGNFRSPGFKSD